MPGAFVLPTLPPLSPFLRDVMADSTAALARRVAERIEAQAVARLDEALIAGAIKGEVAVVFVLTRDGPNVTKVELR